MYEYRCKILKIVDGDTIDVDIDLGFGIWLRNERIRIIGIDTPESRTKDKVEKIFGTAAKIFLSNLIPVDSMQIIRTNKDTTGKFGRILGDIIINDTLLSKIMIESNHAVLYYGQSKKEVTQSHMINRSKLIESGNIKLEDYDEI